MTEEPGLLTATPASLLQSALAGLRLDGAIFFRAELTEGFAFDSTPAEVAGLLHPGAERLVLFHIVAKGSCWVAGTEGDRHWAGQGDVIVVPYGRSPIRYLTEWRMHLAQELLATTRTGVATVARRVGYDSEEAFSRAFKRASGQSPSHWRLARAAADGR